jgi:NAD+ diphosphatase
MDLNYCIECGKPLTFKSIGDEGEQKHCSACNKFYFDNPASCVLVAIVNEKAQVLLLKQNYISTKNYTLCSGYLKKGDTLEETVAREVLEETGIHINILPGFISTSEYTIQGKVEKSVSIFVASTTDTQTIIQQAEIEDYIWLNYSKAIKKLKFENDRSILEKAHEFLLRTGVIEEN